MQTKGLITIAIGKKYVKQAIYLSKSCVLNTPEITRAVITNLPDLLKEYYNIVIPWNNEDDPFSIKTRLYEFSPFDYSLFLDADSLVYNNIEEYWNYLEEKPYIYEGAKLTEGFWYFDIEKTRHLIQTEWIPKFNSGMLLFKKCEEAKNIFDIAYYYFLNHKKEGLEIPFFRGNHYPDEPSFAVSLAKNNIEPVEDYGHFSRTLIKAKKIKLNIKKKYTSIFKNGKTMHPLVIHFCGRKGGLYYLKEKLPLFFNFNFF